jgi:hypothetical protein
VSYVFDTLGVLGVILELCLVIFLLFGPYRKYFVLLIYSLTMLATTVVEGTVKRLRPSDTALFRKIYWSDEVIWFLLLFLTVISLTYIALEGSPLRAKAGRVLGGIFIGVLILPFVLLHPPFFTNAHQWTAAWFNGTSQILDFGGAIMNLALWSALLASRKRDPQLLMVSAGLGVILTGQAIAFGLRHFIHDQRWIPDLLHNLSDLSGMLILCYAVRPGLKPRLPASEALPASSDLL